MFTTEVLFYDKKNKIELVVKNNENQSVCERHFLINRQTIGGWIDQEETLLLSKYIRSHRSSIYLDCPTSYFFSSKRVKRVHR